MKKLFILAVAFGAFSLTSCKKEYTCECTVSTTVNGTTTTTTSSGKTDKLSKKDAKEACDKGDNTTDVAGTKIVSDCEIK